VPKITISVSSSVTKALGLLFPGRSYGEVVKKLFMEGLKSRIVSELSRRLEISNIEEIVDTMPFEVAVSYFLYVAGGGRHARKVDVQRR